MASTVEYDAAARGRRPGPGCVSAITIEPSAPLPEFLGNRARKKVLYAALEGLRKRVMRAEDAIRLVAPFLSAASRLIASSRVSSRLQKVKRTK